VSRYQVSTSGLTPPPASACRRAIDGLTPSGIEWPAFLVAWHRIHRGPVTANELLQTADEQVWAGTFPRTVRGYLPSARSLGRVLTGYVGCPAGDLVIRSVIIPHGRTRIYWVDPSCEALHDV
jgi:hypothetical protein